MFFDNIFGKNNNNNNNTDNNSGSIEYDGGYSLKNISLTQGREFLNDEKKLSSINTYLAQNTGNDKLIGMNIEGFSVGDVMSSSSMPQAAIASASASSAPAEISAPAASGAAPAASGGAPAASGGAPATDKQNILKLQDAFDSKLTAYASALTEYNKEILNNQNYFVVQVRSLVPINDCFNCDPNLSGKDCSAIGMNNGNGSLRTSDPKSTSVSVTANLLPCVQSGVTVPGWSANPNDTGSCIAPLGQKCCTMNVYNQQPVCSAAFGADNYDADAMNNWVGLCITPPSADEIAQKIALANEYCQGNGISLNYWSTNANNFVLVTTKDPANNIRPFAKMNSLPVWIINTFTNMQDANTAKTALVFSPTVQKTLASVRDDVTTAGNILIKAISTQHANTESERKQIKQTMQAVEKKLSKLDSHKLMLDENANVTPSAASPPASSASESSVHKIKKGAASGGNVSNVKETFSSRYENIDPNSLLGQEEDTRIQFKSSYAYYTLWFVFAILIVAVLFSNIFMSSSSSSEELADDEGSEGSEGSEKSKSSSMILIFGLITVFIFIYFIIQYIMVYFNVSRPSLPFNDVNPLFYK